MLELDEQTLSESTEDDVELDASTSEETLGETVPEPDAEDTGDTQGSDTGEEADDESEGIGPVPYPVFAPVRRELTETKRKLESYQQLLSDPDVAIAIKQVRDAKVATVDDDEMDEVILEDKDESEFEDDVTYIMYQELQRQQRARIESRKQEKDAQRREEARRTEAQQAESLKHYETFTGAVKEISTADKMPLDETDQEAVLEQALILEAGLMQLGKPVDYAMLAKQAYALVKPQIEASVAKRKSALQAERDKALRTKKAVLAGGRVADTSGPSSGGRLDEDPREAFERQYREIYGD